MAARIPVCSTNRIAAAAFGPIDPGSQLKLFQHLRCHPVEPVLIGRSPIRVDAVDVRGHDVEIGVDLARQQLAREVFVDDSLDADEVPFGVRIVHRGHASSSGADHHDVLLDQPLDRPDLEDAFGLRGGNHPTPSVAILFDDPPLLGRQGVGLCLVVDRAHELRRVFECGIRWVDLDHREDRGERDLHGQEIPQFLLEDVADHPLRLRAE